MAPEIIDDAKVLLFALIDDGIQTGTTTHYINENKAEKICGLAICQYDSEAAYYLFGCNEKWESITDTFHESIEEAKEQAEFEYNGISTKWVIRK